MKKPWTSAKIAEVLGKKGFRKGKAPKGKSSKTPFTRPAVQHAREAALLKLRKAIKNNPSMREFFEEYL